MARAEFHREVISEELRHPLMLWHRQKSLIEQEFEGIVVCMHHKPPPPEVWPLVPDYLYQANKLALISGQLHVSWCKGPAEEGNGPGSLVKYYSEPEAGRVAVDHERTVELRKL
jgi:hypothetical protein